MNGKPSLWMSIGFAAALLAGCRAAPPAGDGASQTRDVPVAEGCNCRLPQCLPYCRATPPELTTPARGEEVREAMTTEDGSQPLPPDGCSCRLIQCQQYCRGGSDEPIGKL